MKRLWICAGVVGFVAAFQMVGGAGTGKGKGKDKDAPSAKEALQALQDYIGAWKGSGTSEKDKSAIWNEKINWSWRFKGDDAWLTLEFKESKLFKSAEMRYLTDKNIYQLTLTDNKDQKQVFEGILTGPKQDRLTLERKDADSMDTHQILFNMAGGGIRSVYTYSVKPANRTLYNKQWQIALTKEGESFATAKKQIECVVTGGLGTIPVMYKGVTYYVCCGGCRDAFNENPEK